MVRFSGGRWRNGWVGKGERSLENGMFGNDTRGNRPELIMAACLISCWGRWCPYIKYTPGLDELSSLSLSDATAPFDLLAYQEYLWKDVHSANTGDASIIALQLTPTVVFACFIFLSIFLSLFSTYTRRDCE